MRPSGPITIGPEDEIITPPSLYERIIIRASQLPWWAIALIILGVIIIYSMTTSVAYQQVVRQLTDDPQTSTDDLYDAVQIVGEPATITGRYVDETHDTVATIIDEFVLSGFVVEETPASITVETESGPVEIVKERIEALEPPDATIGTEVTVHYIERVTVAGVRTNADSKPKSFPKLVVSRLWDYFVKKDLLWDVFVGDEDEEKTMTIRTENAVTETFSTDRILSRETVTVDCDREADPGCTDQTVTQIQRQGVILAGTLNTLTKTNLSIGLPDGEAYEARWTDVDYFYVPTLTIAVNAQQAEEPIEQGAEVRIGFVKGTDIGAALEQLESLDDLPVSLRYVDGDVLVTLVPYPDMMTLLEATGAGDVDGLIHLVSGPDQSFIAEWVEENPDAGVILPMDPLVCQRDCEVTLKLKDDEIMGTVIKETDDKITIQTTAPEYTVINREDILENRRMVPGVCALNNLSGCDAGIFLTLKVTFMAYALALLIGLFVGLMRVSSNSILFNLATLYVEVVRGLPLLVILLYAGFVVSPELRDTPINLPNILVTLVNALIDLVNFAGSLLLVGLILLVTGALLAAISRYTEFKLPLPVDLRWGFWLRMGLWMVGVIAFIRLMEMGHMGDPLRIDLNDEQEAVMGLAFGYGAFVAEIFRAGIQSIGRGQMEAARSLGMSYPQAMRYVVLPQAVRVVLPPLGNDFIALLKDSALISVLALPDILQLGRLYVSRTFRAFEGYNTVAFMYLLMTLFLSMLVRVIERRSKLPS